MDVVCIRLILSNLKAKQCAIASRNSVLSVACDMRSDVSPSLTVKSKTRRLEAIGHESCCSWVGFNLVRSSLHDAGDPGAAELDSQVTAP